MLVSLQGQVSVFLTDEAYKSFSIPPALSIKTECNPSSVQHNRQVSAEDRQEIVSCTMVKEILGNVESSEEPSDVLVRGLPRQPPGSDHRAVAHLLHLTAAQMHKKVHVEGRTFGFRGEKIDQTLLTKCRFQISH